MSTAPSFEIGLTMAGAVSAGAYTAGVIDFLIEALDAWEAAKAQGAGGDKVPRHDVSLRVISGASAGALTAAILVANLDRRWTPARKVDLDRAGARNPLYASWVKDVDIRRLLETKDLEGGDAPLSLLDSSSLNQIAQSAFSFDPGAEPVRRAYVADPLRAIFTLTNLRGVPFDYELLGNSGLGQDMTLHADKMRFAAVGIGTASAPGVRAIEGSQHEYALPIVAPGHTKWADASWNRFACAALASGAFPGGLSPRKLSRTATDYTNIPVALPGNPPSQGEINPSWGSPASGYDFLSVDGGCIDNEPFELARAELSGGVLNRNARAGRDAKRAVVMIDPFVGPSAPGPIDPNDVPLHLSLFKLLGTYTENSRFNPIDIGLAAKEDVFSRFMIAPRRPTPRLIEDYPGREGTWIASGALGAFSGFLCERYREHDFLLGRRNCQQFLAQYFSLPSENTLFDSWRHDQQLVERYKIAGKDGQLELPVVPLVGRLHPLASGADVEPLPDWPQDVFRAEEIRDAMTTRLDALFMEYRKKPSRFIGFLLTMVWRMGAKKALVGKLEEVIDAALASKGLLSR